ncbi:MAG: hypothetical protein ACOVSW_10680 [Candidatus Kapaibacteriota bacterium]
MTYRYLSVKALIVIAFVAFFSSSCSSVKTLTKDEEEIRRQEVFRVAFALLQQKAVSHSMQDHLIIEIDSTSPYHYIKEVSQESWIREILNIPVVYNAFTVRFRVSVRNQPYLKHEDLVPLNDSKGFIAAQSNWRIDFDKDIENYKRPFHLMHVDTAIAKARNIVGLSDTIPCIKATTRSSRTAPPYQYRCSLCAKSSQQIWHLSFLLEPPDTSYYYEQRDLGKTPQEIFKEIPTRYKPRDYTQDPAETTLDVGIDCETGDICSVDINSRFTRATGPHFGLNAENPNLQPFLDRVDSICKSKFRYYRRQKWKE